MRANEIIVGTNDVILNNYLVDVHSGLNLFISEKGIFIMDKWKMLEFIPHSNVLNVINLSKSNEDIFYITYQNY